MSISSKDEPYLHFRAPRQHGAVLCVPDPVSIRAEISKNSHHFETEQASIRGQSLRELRQSARSELATILNVPTGKPWILGGHQPELFHPGVWLKNFALHRLAQANHAVAIHYVVDQDVCKNVTLRVPTLNRSDELELESIPWDAPTEGVPWERFFLKSPDIFERFAETVGERLQAFGIHPLIHALWEQAVPLATSQHSVGEAFAIARHTIEKKHGLQSTDFFSRQLVSTSAFRMLLLHWIDNRALFRHRHNESLAHYRSAHRIRSSAHPVADLKQQGHEIEIPLWVYSAENPRRRAVYAAIDSQSVYLTDRQTELLRWSQKSSDESILEQFSLLEQRGTFLRPRALLTTMALRLLFADWFIHGIGGGKYDQLNDIMIQQFFGITPPQYSVITGTLYLPMQTSTPKATEQRTLNGDLAREHYQQWLQCKSQWLSARQLKRRHFYHPETLAREPPPALLRLLEMKSQLLRQIPQRGPKRDWHRRLSEVRDQIAELLGIGSVDYAAGIESSRRAMQQAQIRISREFSLALFPEQWLVSKMQLLANQCCPELP
jgi:hypothetical protein